VICNRRACNRRFEQHFKLVMAIMFASQSWKDERLAWSADEYGGLDTLRVPAKLVWTPDMTLYNT